MTTYIAGPMSGIPEFNYPLFAAVAKELRANGVDVVSPHELHNGDTSQPYTYYLRRDLKALLECDDMVLLPGWRNSKGAKLEARIAVALDITMIEWRPE